MGPATDKNVQLIGYSAISCTAGVLLDTEVFTKADVNGKDFNKSQAAVALSPTASTLFIGKSQYVATSGAISIIQSTLNNGDTVSLRFSSGAISFTAGNINLSGNPSPVTIPDGAKVSFALFHLRRQQSISVDW